MIGIEPALPPTQVVIWESISLASVSYGKVLVRVRVRIEPALPPTQVKSRVTLRGNTKAARSVNRRGPARWGRVVGMHAAAPAALWAAWDGSTCAGAALLATFLSDIAGSCLAHLCALAQSSVLSVLRSLLSRLPPTSKKELYSLHITVFFALANQP